MSEHYAVIDGRPAAGTEQCGELTADRLAELRFLAESRFAIPIVPKHELALLLDAYEAQRRG